MSVNKIVTLKWYLAIVCLKLLPMVSSAAWACIVKLRSDDDAPQSDPLVSDGLKSISVGSCFAMRSSAITCEKESEVRSENDSEEEETYLLTANTAEAGPKEAKSQSSR